MPKSTKKQPVKKRGRPAKKKTKVLKNITLHNYEVVPSRATSKDTEIESLAAICSIFDNWTAEQKTRVLKFLCGRYYDFM